jgi:hypothetical protein
MKPEAFLPSNSPGLGSASVVPVTPPASVEPVAGARPPAPRTALSPAQFYEWAGRFLRDNRTAPRPYRLELINWRHQYQQQQEAAELRANPAAEENLRRIAERLARKAQSGFSPSPPPSDLAAAIKAASL